CNGNPASPLPPTCGPNGRIFRPVTPQSLSGRQPPGQSQHRRGSFSGSYRTVTPQDSISSCWNKAEQADALPTGSVRCQDKRDDAFWPPWLARWLPAPHGCFKERENYALYLLGPDNRLRILCQRIVTLKSFDYTVLFFIALNCITLAMERPSIPPDSIERQFLRISNNIFTWIFTVEMSLKVAAKGLVLGQHAYLKSGWNIMDGALVAVSLIDALITLIAGSSNRIFGILRVFRLLRTLRPLRVISRAPGLKLVVQTLLSSLRPIGNIVLICCTFFIIFGILGVQLFKGKFYYCDGPDVSNVMNITDCLADKRNKWIKHKYNFDNLGQALMALFVLSSKDGWVQIMYTGLDAVGENMQPKENHNEWLLLYFISFLLLVGFFVLNMFVGVVVENFHKCRASQEKEEKARRAAKRARRMEKRR
uniref:Ion_trans domain-containing protein n=1 Tax=Macrostomum lignano TaxID=282301 RepID=A0A1I8GKA7_9PLAT